MLNLYSIRKDINIHDNVGGNLSMRCIFLNCISSLLEKNKCTTFLKNVATEGCIKTARALLVLPFWMRQVVVRATLVGFSGMMSAFSSFDLCFVAFQDDNQYFKCINLEDFNKPMKLVEHYNQ